MNQLPPAGFEPTPDDQEFWAATEHGVLSVCRCSSCGRISWYPRPFCPFCGGPTTLVPATGRGTVYSYTIVRRARGAFRECAPYVVAYVELEEGPRILSNVVGCDPQDVRVGLPVTVAFDEPSGQGGPRLYRFRPDSRPA